MNDKIAKIIVYIYFGVFIINALFLITTNLIMRFSHPEYTETQLIINHIKEYWYSYVVFAIFYIIRFWREL